MGDLARTVSSGWPKGNGGGGFPNIHMQRAQGWDLWCRRAKDTWIRRLLAWRCLSSLPQQVSVNNSGGGTGWADPPRSGKLCQPRLRRILASPELTITPRCFLIICALSFPAARRALPSTVARLSLVLASLSLLLQFSLSWLVFLERVLQTSSARLHDSDLPRPPTRPWPYFVHRGRRLGT